MTRRGSLFRKYVVVFAGLVGAALLASGLLEIYFSYGEHRVALAAIQREKALAAAARIAAFVDEIERQVRWTAEARLGGSAEALQQRRLDFVRLQKHEPALTEIAYLDAEGREQLRVSLLAIDVVGGGADFSREPRFVEAKGSRVWRGPVYFRKESEPYMTIAIGGRVGAGVTVAEVNLKFIWNVVSRITIGRAGLAYVVDREGALVAHPDISLVLQKTSLASLDQVKAALAAVRDPARRADDVTIARDRAGRRVLTDYATIPELGWAVFVEQPLGEAFEPLYASVQRTGMLVLAGIVLSIGVSLLLARRMVTPIQALGAGAARIGAGDLGQRLDIQTGDELEALADQFNRMAAQLQESYAGLERKVEERTRELTEALEQQTVTAEILRVISSSPTDAQPVFQAIVDSAVRLCGARVGVLFRYDGHAMHRVAVCDPEPGASPAEELPRLSPVPEGGPFHRAVTTRAPVNIEDVETEPGIPEQGRQAARARRYRSLLCVPVLRDGTPIGVINLGRDEAGKFSGAQVALLETFAQQAVIAIENVRLFTEREARNRELTEALEQQTATAEILRVISSSPTDVQPVLDAVAENATRVCEAGDGAVLLIREGACRIVAHYGDISMPYDEAIPIVRGTVAGRAMLDGAPVHVPDLLAAGDEFPEGRALGERFGNRTTLAAPLLREDTPIGALLIRRTDVRPFSDKQIALLQTFADQAVIAIENVRLFTELGARNRELSEALEQQTATAEILRAISGSPTDVQPVFDTIVERSVRLTGAANAAVYRYDGELIHLAALSRRESAEWLQRQFPRAPNPGSLVDRAILERRIVAVADLEGESDVPLSQAAGRAWGHRAQTVVPMLRGDEPIGAVVIVRTECGLFAEKQVALLKTFADQAVIAIENVRLFTELKARNRDLSEALEQQTATADVLRVISGSPTDIQPVLDVVVENAARLCGAVDAVIYRVEDGQLRLVAKHGAVTFPMPIGATMPLTRGSVSGRVVVDRTAIHLEDFAREAESEFPVGKALQKAYGHRTVLAVPLLREGTAIGAITVLRTQVRPFADKQVALLKTFADQAVIAIENVRLFKELEARTRELARSVEELRALGEVGRAVSSTLDLETVLATIVSRANQLSGTDAGAIYEYDEAAELFHLRATQDLPDEVVESLRAMPLRRGEGAVGRLADTREPVQIADIAREGEYTSRLRGILTRTGYHALLAVPLLREDHIIGGLVVNRMTPGAFSPEVVELLTTFATQSALAIQNARLFEELGEKSRQLEVADRHKSEFLANMSHELRTPLNAIIGFSEVLLERMFGELNDKQDEYLRDIFGSGRHLLSLINDILDLSKIEAGRMELEVTRFDVPAAIDNALTLVRGRAANHGIVLSAEVDPRLGEFSGDERKLKQVLLNLLSNAIKFTSEGGRVEVRAVPADGGIEIAVNDTGIGIAREDQEAIFEEFRQVGSDYARKREGTGLGLALTRRFVQLHGGTLRVESEPGKGSTFTFTFPERPWPAS